MAAGSGLSPGRTRLDADARAAIEVSHLRFLSPEAIAGLAVDASRLRVEVAVDGRWANATLAPPVGDFARRRWSFDLDATSGEHELACRATDAAGDVQPLAAPWNHQGMGSNVVQRILCTVR
jgi:hypothetical protein